MLKPIGILILAGICFAAAQGTGVAIFFHLSYLLLALVLLSYAWAWFNLRGLSVEREVFTQRTQVGEQVRERLTLRNLWPITKLWVELRDSSELPGHAAGFVASLPGKERKRWHIKTEATLRGRYTLGPAILASGDPFGIFRLTRSVPTSGEVLIYPPTAPLARLPLPTADLSGGDDVRSRTFQVTPNVSSVREYAPGDSFNRIHWRSTARAGKLISKEFELDPTAEFYLVLDMQQRAHTELTSGMSSWSRGRERNPESTEEYCVAAAASAARYLIERSRAVGLVSWGQNHALLPAERESRQLYKILEELAVVRAQGQQPLGELLLAEQLRFSRGTTLLVVTADPDLQWVAALQQQIYRGVRAGVILVDPATFGAAQSTDAARGRLQVLGVPVYTIGRGMTLADAVGG